MGDGAAYAAGLSFVVNAMPCGARGRRPIIGNGPPGVWIENADGFEIGMIISVIDGNVPEAVTVAVTGDALTAELFDGRTITAPLAWYPRLGQGTPRERNNWRLIAGGQSIHWPDLDEDISIESLLSGRASKESQRSLKKWLESRQIGAAATPGKTA